MADVLNEIRLGAAVSLPTLFGYLFEAAAATDNNARPSAYRRLDVEEVKVVAPQRDAAVVHLEDPAHPELHAAG